MDKTHRSEFTRLLYVTTGLLLKRIVSDRSEISRYTHIILDEVILNSKFVSTKNIFLKIHEREIDMDFILLIIKLLRIQGFKLKVKLN